MNNLLDDNHAAQEWADYAILRNSNDNFGKLVPAIIWTDAKDKDGEILVPQDPLALASDINSNPYILLHNHDPGRPKGQVLESAVFKTREGNEFVVGIVGFYAGGDVKDFQEVGFDTTATALSPARLPVLPDHVWIEVAVDPREVEETWLELVIGDAPLRIKRTVLSHNAEDSAQELIRIGLTYLAVVWNPFITAIASEAGKSTYAAVHAWIRKLLNRLAERHDPILDIHTHQDGCQVSFIFRGKDVQQHYVAHDGLAHAAAQAASLVANLKAQEMAGRQLVYEFDKDAFIWFPSYAILNDGRIITNNAALIAIERLPEELSLGIRLE